MNSKKRQPKTKSKEIEKKSGIKLKILIAIIGAILLLAVVYFLFAQGSDTWTVSKDGILSYPENRGKVDVKVLNTTKGSNYTLETISFASKDYTVEGLLRIPSSDKKMPAVVILPGATVPKEGTQGLAELLSNLGYASLGIEQRNRGGVNPQYDYELFKAGEEPIEHKMVFDALRSVDVLKQDSRIEAKSNALGLRAPPPTPKAAGEWRIAVTGGSAVWGWRVLDADTIPVRLQAA
ncbi:MAG: hypothetical protein O8C56_05695, partial [Candidatus Methanoperedens sp.]|nr:hypothetical protein [Candidatus Methanoperedens sp.]